MENHAARNFLRRVWNSLRAYLNSDDRWRVLEMLSEEYTEKSENVLKLTDYAAHMVYPQFRDKLLGIAAEEQGYIRWLAEHITALGGQIPQVRFSPRAGKNGWERLLTVLEKKEAPQFRPNRTLTAVGADSPKSCTRTATHATGGSNPSRGNPGDGDEERSAGWN